MCVIIHKPKNIDISQDILKKCWKANPHGVGFMYVTPGGFLHIEKGLMTLDSFIKKYVEHKCIKKEVVIHFRLASAGKITPEQTHPFWVFKDQVAFVHNGHMEDYYDVFGKGPMQSDTMNFNEQILKKLPQNFLENQAIVKLLSNYLGSSIMVFMDNLGKVKIIGNNNVSFFHQNCWFSNDYWMDDKEWEEKELQAEKELGESSSASSDDFDADLYGNAPIYDDLKY